MPLIPVRREKAPGPPSRKLCGSLPLNGVARATETRENVRRYSLDLNRVTGSEVPMRSIAENKTLRDIIGHDQTGSRLRALVKSRHNEPG